MVLNTSYVLSKWPHFHRVYSVTIYKRRLIAVCSWLANPLWIDDLILFVGFVSEFLSYVHTLHNDLIFNMFLKIKLHKEKLVWKMWEKYVCINQNVIKVGRSMLVYQKVWIFEEENIYLLRIDCQLQWNCNLLILKPKKS